MIRPFTLLCGVFAAGSMLYLYQSKHQAQMLDRDIAHTLKAADEVKGRIGILRAEYQMLNDPARLQELADKHLALRPTVPTQFATLADISRRLPAVELAPAEPPPEPPETELFELPPVPPPAPAVAPAPVVAAPPKPVVAPPPPRPASPPAPAPLVAAAQPQAAKPAALTNAPTPLRPAAPTPSTAPAQPTSPVVAARPSPATAPTSAIAATPLAPPTHTATAAAPLPQAAPQTVQRPQLQQVSAVRPVSDAPRPAFTSALGMARARPTPPSAPNYDGPAR